KEVDRGVAATICDRPELLRQRAVHPFLRHPQHDESRPKAPAARLERRRGGRWQPEHRTGAPDDLSWLRRREVELLLNVANAAESRLIRTGNAVDRNDRSGDEVPVRRDLERHDRLHIQVEERLISEVAT